MPEYKRWWVSWWMEPDHEFNLSSPWWESGYRWDADDNQQHSICAALFAVSEEHCKQLIDAAYDAADPESDARPVEWRFIEMRPNDWDPFCDRFPRYDWMQWPVKGAST